MHYSAYFTVPTRFIFLLFAFFGKLLEALAQFSWGRWLLLRFPRVFSYGLFSRAGPTEQQMAQTRFEMRFIGHGYAQGTLSISLSRKLCAHSRTTSVPDKYCIVVQHFNCVVTVQCMTQAWFPVVRSHARLAFVTLHEHSSADMTDCCFVKSCPSA